MAEWLMRAKIQGVIDDYHEDPEGSVMMYRVEYPEEAGLTTRQELTARMPEGWKFRKGGSHVIDTNQPSTAAIRN